MAEARETHTTARPVRIPDEDWTEFGEVVGDRERSRVLREFIAWYLRRPQSPLPKRPDLRGADYVVRDENGTIKVVEAKSTHRPGGR